MCEGFLACFQVVNPLLVYYLPLRQQNELICYDSDFDFLDPRNPHWVLLKLHLYHFLEKKIGFASGIATVT